MSFAQSFRYPSSVSLNGLNLHFDWQPHCLLCYITLLTSIFGNSGFKQVRTYITREIFLSTALITESTVVSL